MSTVRGWPRAFWALAIVFLVLGLIPLYRGRPLNVTFLALAVVFFAVSAARRRRA